MPTNSNRFKHESFQDCESIVRYTRALTEGFENGALQLYLRWETHGAEAAGHDPLEIEAQMKDDQVRLSVKFRWSQKESAEAAEAQPLVIRANHES
jgi:amphi-Trp domain-containing protein